MDHRRALVVPGYLKTRKGLLGEDTRRVLDLALPAVGEQLLNMSIGLVDTFMVGHLGATAVAAVSMANQMTLIITTFFAAVATGMTALIARHCGAKEPEKANQILQQGYLLGAVMGLVLGVLAFLFARPALWVLQSPADVLDPGAGYLRIVALSFLLASWLFVGSAALRGMGDTRTPMLVMLAVNVVNIAIAYLAIFGCGPIPPMGVEGSAIGATVGRGVGGLIITWVLLRGRNGLRLQISRLAPDVLQIKRILNIGMPAAGEQLLMRVGQTAFVATVAGMGTQVLAAHQIALQGESLSFMPGFGFAVAATTLAGRGLGAGDPARARADAVLAQRLGILVMSVMGLLFFVFAPQLVGLFVNDPEVIRLGIGPLRLEAFSQPALASLMILSGALRGAGDTRVTMVITAVGIWLVRLPVAFLLSRHFGLMGAYFGMGLDLNLRSLGMWLRFRSDGWTRLKV